MKTKKVPERMCVFTKEKMPKKDLIRIVMFNDEISVDVTGKKNGRGCYLKKEEKVVLEAKKKKVLNKVFKKDVEDRIYDEIIDIIKKG